MRLFGRILRAKHSKSVLPVAVVVAGLVAAEPLLAETRRVTTNVDGTDGANHNSTQPFPSHDGRRVVYLTRATNVAEDANPSGLQLAVIAHDLVTDERQTVAVGTNLANVVLSGDGEFVTFDDPDNQLGEGAGQIFRWPWGSNAPPELVSRGIGGAAADDRSTNCGMSFDGRFVVFSSNATNLVAIPTEGRQNVFVRDMDALGVGVTLVSIDADGTVGGNGLSGGPSDCSVSSDGRRIAFSSLASNLVKDDNNGFADVFVRDLDEEVTIRVSLDPLGVGGNGDSLLPVLSGDGRQLFFSTCATTLVVTSPKPPTLCIDAEIVRVELSQGAPLETTDALKAFRPPDASLPAGLADPAAADESVVRIRLSRSARYVGFQKDFGQAYLYRWDAKSEATELVSLTADGTELDDSAFGRLSGNGQVLLFQSSATNAVPDDDEGRSDIFVRGLHVEARNKFTQFVDGVAGGFNNRTRTILINNAAQADAGQLRFQSAEGAAAAVPVDGAASNEVPYSLGAFHTTEIVTDGISDPLLTGTINIVSTVFDDPAESGLEGTVAFEILGKFVSIADAPQVTQLRVYVSREGDENTGVALCNPLAAPVTLEIRLFDSDGVEVAATEIELAAGNQLVRFVDEDALFKDFFAANPGDFSGSMTIGVKNGGSFSGLGLLQDLSSGALIAVASSSAGQPGRLLFAHYLNGEVGGQPNGIRIILMNGGPGEDTGTVHFRDATGAPASVPIDGQPVQSVDYALDAGGTTEITTDGTGDLQTGTIEINSDLGQGSSLVATEVFEVLGNFVSVLRSPARNANQAYVSVSGTESTGVALLNPDDAAAVTLTLILVDSTGVERARKDIVLQAGEQLVRFVNEAELFKDFFDGLPPGTDFRGTLNVFAEDGRTAAVLGLLQDLQSGALIAVQTSPNAFDPAAP